MRLKGLSVFLILVGMAPLAVAIAEDVTVSWPCRTRSGEVQDEYCEWQTPQTLPDGGLRCTFTSSLAEGRVRFLTQVNRSNSAALLLALISSCERNAASCNAPNCLPNRQADPAVCEAVSDAFALDRCVVAPTRANRLSPLRNRDGKPVMQVVIGPGIERDYCSFVAAPGAAGSQSEQTLLQCDLPAHSAYDSCEQLAESIFVRATLELSACE